MVLPDELVLPAHKETRVPLVLTVLLVLRVSLDHMVTKVLKVLRVHEVKMVKLVLPVQLVFPVRSAPERRSRSNPLPSTPTLNSSFTSAAVSVATR